MTLSTKYFQALAVRTAAGRGMPDLRQVILPFPLETEEEVRVRQAGLDACKPIVAALTTGSAPSLSEVKQMSPRLTSSRVSIATEDEALERFYREGWTDGLPVVLPTPERVEAMIEGSGLAPDQVVAKITPLGAEATVEKIAINAVMAGCRPEYMPVIIAAVKALVQPRFNLHGIQTTTNPAGMVVVVNGPIRDKLQINSGASCFGPGTRSNATIGRAVRLVCVNIGGAAPGEIDKATQGQPGKFTFCFGENEEESPWQPFHVERGFKKEDSVVSVMGSSGTHNATTGGNDMEELLTTLGRTMIGVGLNSFRHGDGDPMIVLCPQHAQAIAKAGYSKDDLKRKLNEYSALPLSFLSKGAVRQRFQNHPITDPVPLIRDYKDINVLVAGGPGGLHSTFLPTFGDTWACSEKIEAPA